MNLSRSTTIRVCVVATLALAGCKPSPTPIPDTDSIWTSITTHQNPVPDPAEGWVRYRETDFQTEGRLIGIALRAAFDKDFALLEALADTAHKQQHRLPDGSFASKTLIQSFSDYDSNNRVDPEKWQPVLESALQEWVRSYPKSTTARTALAGFLLDYAYAATRANITEFDRRRLFRERLAAAHETLIADPSLVENDPVAALLMISLFRASRSPQDEVIPSVSGMISDHPRFWHLYAETIHLILSNPAPSAPRDAHEWLIQELRATGLPSDEADLIYARVLLPVISDFYRTPAKISGIGLDLPRLRAGTIALLEHYPDSTRIPTYALKLGVLTRDPSMIGISLAHLQFRYDKGLWGGQDDAEFFRTLNHIAETYPDLPVNQP